MITKDSLTALLKENIVTIKFKKQDGTERVMKCSLKPEVVPDYVSKTNKRKKPNEGVLAVWDLDKESFRSFKLDSLIEYLILEGN